MASLDDRMASAGPDDHLPASADGDALAKSVDSSATEQVAASTPLTEEKSRKRLSTLASASKRAEGSPDWEGSTFAHGKDGQLNVTSLAAEGKFGRRGDQSVDTTNFDLRDKWEKTAGREKAKELPVHTQSPAPKPGAGIKRPEPKFEAFDEWVLPKWNSSSTGLTVFSDLGGLTKLIRHDPKTGAEWCAAWGAGRVAYVSQFPKRQGEFYQKAVPRRLNSPVSAGRPAFNPIRSSGLAGHRTPASRSGRPYDSRVRV